MKKIIQSNQIENEGNDAQAKRGFTSRMQETRDALTDAGKQDTLLEDCLAVDAQVVLCVELSTGGPADGFKITCDAVTGQPVRGCYYFANWSFYRDWPLSRDELDAVCVAYAIEDARLYLNRRNGSPAF